MRISGAIDFNAPVLNYARKDFPLLEADASVEKALEAIRREGIGERVIYFYAIDERKHLVGVVPTRRLLTAAPNTLLREIMVPRVITLPAEATVLEACEFFVLYKFLAFPVVDAGRRLIGIVDTDVFMDSVLESEEGEREETRSDLFEALGFHLAQVRDVSPWRVIRYRFRWLLVTVIGGGIAVSLVSACLIGLGVPWLLHAVKLDPKIAAGPVTLALADIFALVIYFTTAWPVLR